MIKTVLAPVQGWILLQGKCVGCGKNLTLGKKINLKNNTNQIICYCGRIYIFSKRTGKYRRAHLNEINNV